jgi:hypothetical protein
MTNLDINTPRGQQTLTDEKRAVELFTNQYKRWKYQHTNKTTMAKADAILTKDDEVAGLVLMSCRYNCSVDTMMTTWGAEWLLTWRKLAIGALLARYLQTPLYGFIYIVAEDTLLIKKLFDPLKPEPWCAAFHTELTQTQATVNGGSVIRRNAYIKIDNATRIVGMTDATRAGYPKGFVGYDPDGNLLHFCHCGKDAGFGHGVSLRNGKLGTWFCKDHNTGDDNATEDTRTA